MIIRVSILILSLLLQLVFSAEYSNPLWAPDGADPNIVYQDGWYYLTTTIGTHLHMIRAETLEGLKQGEEKSVYETDAEGRCCNVWAPEMHNIDGRWHIYYAAGPVLCCDGQRSHVLQGGASPWDDYTYIGQIRQDWSIDGTVLYINETRYFVYSGHEEDGSQSLFIAEMTGPATTGDSVLIASPDQEWETHGTPVNEGAYALYKNGKTWLSFSASHCETPNYALGLLTYNGGEPLDMASWQKSGPVFTSANGDYGPGHNSFFTSPDGKETWNVYHSVRNSSGSCGPDRATHAQKLNWNEDGTPNFGEPVGDEVKLPGPGGE